MYVAEGDAGGMQKLPINAKTEKNVKCLRCSELEEEVRRLRKALSDLYKTQESRIEAVKEIARRENKAIYEHAHLLSRNQDRYSVQNLSDIDLGDLLSERNPVLVSFLKEICMPSTGLLEGKQYLAHAIDLIYAARHPRFVSGFMAAIQVVLYSITGSRLAVDLIGHVSAGPCYDTVNNILFKGDFKFKDAPEGLIEFSFDNEQRIAKNYINRNGNNVTLDIFTNIIVSQLDKGSTIQYQPQLKPSQWLPVSAADIITKEESECDKFSVIADEALSSYLSSLFLYDAVSYDQTKQTDDIDVHIDKRQQTENTVICPKCLFKHHTEGKSKILKCRSCGVWMGKYRKAAQKRNTSTYITPVKRNRRKQSLVFHECTGEVITKHSGEQSVKIVKSTNGAPDKAEIYVIHPKFVNPNTVESVKEVLNHIAKVGNIRSHENLAGERKQREWLIIRCDGLPYIIIRIILSEDVNGEFSWVVLRTGVLHEEINAVKSFVSMYWDVIYRDFAISQGYSSDKSLEFVKKCSDHHISFDLLCKFRDCLWGELLHEFRVSNPTVDVSTSCFLGWLSAAAVSDPHMNFMYNILLQHLHEDISLSPGYKEQRC
ncbi:uncharacterized protein [Ptychodera flava]|uniref:uncharacterized protein n=1 Tax=Ptychodera flava TaxID=63121 RepID=UPI003969C531